MSRDSNLTPPTPIDARRSHRKKPAPAAPVYSSDTDPAQSGDADPEDLAMAAVLAKIAPVDAMNLDRADEPDPGDAPTFRPAARLDGVPASFSAGMTADEGPETDDDSGDVEESIAARLRTNFDAADTLDDVGRMVPREFVQPVPELVGLHRNSDGDRRPRNVNADALATALGAKRWRDAPVFDWCRMIDGRRHTFSKSYFEQGVLVDIFAARTPAVVREIGEKRAAIAAYNLTAERGFGYLPTIRGSIIPLEFISAVLAGEVLDLTQMQGAHDVAPVKFDAYAAAGGDIYEQAKMRGVV